MLRNIPEVISPDLMKALMEMGAGDDLCLCENNFPAADMSERVIRADGVKIESLLEAILQFMPLDTSIPLPAILMTPPDGVSPDVWNTYESIIKENDFAHAFTKFDFLDFYPFHNRAGQCFVTVVTGDCREYSNIILQRGAYRK